MTSVGLSGCGTALVTPFMPDGAVDELALRRLVEWQLEQGVQFVIPCGSTGEAATLSVDEHARVVAITAEVVHGRVPVVAGAGANDTQRAIALSRACQRAGATHLLQVSPMYNKPQQRGIVAHFEAIAAAVDLPIVVYNVPGRTASNIEAATTLRLATVPGIVGIKEASANLSQIDLILRERPDGFAVLSGDDAWTLPLMAMGADGVISVISNLVPAAMRALTDACAAGRFAEARAVHRRLQPLMTAAFVESNPVPIKAALQLAGRIQNVVRLPLVPLSEGNIEAVQRAWQAAEAVA